MKRNSFSLYRSFYSIVPCGDLNEQALGTAVPWGNLYEHELGTEFSSLLSPDVAREQDASMAKRTARK